MTKVLNGSAVSCSGVHSGEDDIKVDRFSSEDIVPFHVGKFRYSFSAENPKFHEFEVKGMVLDHFLLSSWLGVRKISLVDSDVSWEKSDSSGARFFEDPCVRGD